LKRNLALSKSYRLTYVIFISNEFKITPMSTEKSREKEVANRLSIEKKLRNELIEKYSSAASQSQRK
jgi:hypothetical protein